MKTTNILLTLAMLTSGLGPLTAANRPAQPSNHDTVQAWVAAGTMYSAARNTSKQPHGLLVV